MKLLRLRTTQQETLVDITEEVHKVITESGLTDGAVLVFSPHTTAGVYVNEGADPDVRSDTLNCLRIVAPQNRDWRHCEGNAPAHIKAILTGSSVTIPITAGKLALGTWQRIFFAEFDGPRDRSVYIQVLRA